MQRSQGMPSPYDAHASTPQSADDGHDPLEAIYALNIGDFLTEDFMSAELLDKIADSVGSCPDKLKRQLEEMIQIYSLEKTLGVMGFQPDESFVLYDSIASTLARMFQADACHIFQTTRCETGEEHLSLTGTSRTLSGAGRWQIGLEITPDSIFLPAWQTSRSVSLLNVQDDPRWQPLPRLEQESVRALLATPLCEAGKRLGLLTLERHEPHPFGSELIALAEATARLFVVAMRLQQLSARAQAETLKSPEHTRIDELRSLRAQMTEHIGDLSTCQQQFVECLGAAIDARCRFMRGHARRVADIARRIAEAMNLNEKTVDLAYYAGLLGTIGKMEIPRQVLVKEEGLQRDEWEALRAHPNVGASLLAQIHFLSDIVPYVTYQNARWDGSGLPAGLAGKDIPLGSRILAVADAYVAMLADRPYRGEGLDHDNALRLLQAEAGIKWDPDVVAAFVSLSVPDTQP